MADDDPAELPDEDARPFRDETTWHRMLRRYWRRWVVVVLVVLLSDAVLTGHSDDQEGLSVLPMKTATVVDKTYATFTAKELKAEPPVCRQGLRALPLQQTLLFVQALNDAHASDDKFWIKWALDHLAAARLGAMAAWQPGQPARLCAEGHDLKVGEHPTVAESTIGEVVAAISTLGAGRDGNGVSAYYQHGDALNKYLTQIGKLRDLREAFFPRTR